MTISPTRRAKEHRETLRRVRDFILETHGDVFDVIESVNVGNYVEKLEIDLEGHRAP